MCIRDRGSTGIIPVYTYGSARTFQVAKRLFELGVYVNPVVAPAVPEDECLLRTSYTATHTFEQMDRAAVSYTHLGKKEGSPGGW